MKKKPKFIDSPYFVMESDNWHIKNDAPEEIKKEFEEYMKESDVILEFDE